MSPDVNLFVQSCETCRRSKPSNQKPAGLLNPLQIPSLPWEAIGIDFVGPLPLSRNRDGEFDSITTIIDLLTGMVHLVPSRDDYTAKDVAELIFAEVYKHHGLPKSIISDRDVLFTSGFWTHLNKLIGTTLRMSSAYHPESDGSTECANRTIGQMLRSIIGTNHKDWVSKLPAVEFAINLARSKTTGYSPFFLNTGRMPRTLVWDSATPNEFRGVKAFAQRVKSGIMAAHDSIIAARAKQTKYANNKRTNAPFVDGDLVYLSTKNIRWEKGTTKKFMPKFIGPYKIIQDYGNMSYRIDLPAELKARGVHPVFHASLLRVHVPNDDRLFPGRTFEQVAGFTSGSAREWDIDHIASHVGKGATSVMQVFWKTGDTSWMEAKQIEKTNAMTQYLTAQGVENILDLPQGTDEAPDDPQIYIGMIGLDFSTTQPCRRMAVIARSLNDPQPGPADEFTHIDARINWLVFDEQKSRYEFIYSTTLDYHLTIEVATLWAFVLFDSEVRSAVLKGDAIDNTKKIDDDASIVPYLKNVVRPFGYDGFARMFNTVAHFNGYTFIRMALNRRHVRETRAIVTYMDGLGPRVPVYPARHRIARRDPVPLVADPSSFSSAAAYIQPSPFNPPAYTQLTATGEPENPLNTHIINARGFASVRGSPNSRGGYSYQQRHHPRRVKQQVVYYTDLPPPAATTRSLVSTIRSQSTTVPENINPPTTTTAAAEAIPAAGDSTRLDRKHKKKGEAITTSTAPKQERATTVAAEKPQRIKIEKTIKPQSPQTKNTDKRGQVKVSPADKPNITTANSESVAMEIDEGAVHSFVEEDRERMHDNDDEELVDYDDHPTPAV